MSNLLSHAKRELSLINEDPEYTDAYLKIVEIFDGMDHSGGAAGISRMVIHSLLAMENLSPLTDNPEEWFDHGEFHQNVRNGEAFSRDGGKTYYLLSEGGNEQAYLNGEVRMHTSRSYEKLKQVQEADV